MEDDFTSGPWTGFYTYANSRRERMDLALAFRQGVVTGSGSDPVGFFTIDGRYDPESNEIHWTKTYPGSHDVFYKGCRDSRGIWGTWQLRIFGSGGFHIWPKGQGEGLTEHAKAETEQPVDAVAPAEQARRL
ncbi:MAG: hypothetical protein HY293_04800 [Planctomycetes bacterium]|nr:hypothetical protein [Planctomycetota bacterium]